MRLVRALLRLLRILVALAILAVAERLNWTVERLLPPPLPISRSVPRAPMHPLERLLLGSLVGLAICALWIAITWRAAS